MCFHSEETWVCCSAPKLTFVLSKDQLRPKSTVPYSVSNSGKAKEGKKKRKGFSSWSKMKNPQVEIQKIAFVPHYHRGKWNRASYRVRLLIPYCGNHQECYSQEKEII